MSGREGDGHLVDIIWGAKGESSATPPRNWRVEVREWPRPSLVPVESDVARLGVDGATVLATEPVHVAIDARVLAHDRELGIAEVIADVLPQDKASVVNRLTGAGHVVAMESEAVDGDQSIH